MNELKELIEAWKDTPESHQAIHNLLCEKTNQAPALKRLRDWVESNIWGFGERSFYWMWKLIIQELREDFAFLEVGVFRGQTLALVKMLQPQANVYGVTPLDSTGDHWESDYKADINKIHELFNVDDPTIIKGLSTDESVINLVDQMNQFDIVYIDGGHSYEVVKQDMTNYPNFVKVGGYLVVDDCCNKYRMPNGMFPGIATVSKAVDEWTEKQNDFTELFSVVHIRVFKRIK